MTQRYSMGPDFVILGVTLAPGKVMVIASDSPYAASLDCATEPIEYWKTFSERHTIPGPSEYRLSTRMASCVVVYGKDYAEALRNLFSHWTPKDKQGLPAPTLELEGQ